jgi:DNA polymerase-1
MSKGDVNLQNFPKRGNIEVRNIITAPKDHLIVAFDYGQLEARLLAMASRDEVFCDAIWNDSDTHFKWTDKLIEACPDVLERNDVTRKQFRDDNKTNWTFAIFYGSVEESIVAYYYKEYGIMPDVIKKLYEEFWETYPSVKKWQEDVVRFYNEHQYITSLTGRRRHGPLSVNKIINFPIQSTASYDICLCAGDRLSDLAYALDKPQYQYRINIHDDLTFYLPEETLEEDILFIAKEMCRPVYDFIIVPLQVECSVGSNWGSMSEIGKWDSKDFGFMVKK